MIAGIGVDTNADLPHRKSFGARVLPETCIWPPGTGALSGEKMRAETIAANFAAKEARRQSAGRRAVGVRGLRPSAAR